MNKVTKESIEAKIVNKKFQKISDKLTHCILTLENGFQVTGESACVDPKNYDQAIGEEVAYDDAFKKIWEIEGYLLQEKLHLKKLYEERNPRLTIHQEEALKLALIKELHEIQFERFMLGEDDFKKQYPLTPNEAFKLTSAGTSQQAQVPIQIEKVKAVVKSAGESLSIEARYRPDIKEVLIDLEDPEVKAKVFKSMFPNANEHTFDALEKDLKEITHVHTDNWEYDLDLILLREDVKGQIDGMSLKNVKASYNRAGKMVEVDIRDQRVRRAIFDRLFPLAPKYKVSNEHVYVESKNNRVADYLLSDERSKKELFVKMFPGSTENDFKKLENRQAVTDELSFMEKYEKIQMIVGSNHPEVNKEFEKEKQIKFNKLVRQEVDIIVQALKGSDRKSPERSTTIRKFIEGVMWLGQDLKAIGTPDPYPESKNPNNVIVEKTADGLKF